MLSKESAGHNSFDLPEEVLEILPADPFEQLDVARKITSIALSTRVSALESEASALRHELGEKDAIIGELQSHVESLDAALGDVSDKLAGAEQEKESLLKENAELSATVKKLERDVTKLEAFRKKLMRSLQDGEETAAGDAGALASAMEAQKNIDDNATLPPRRSSSARSQFSDLGSSYSEDADTEASRPRISPGLLLASQNTTPRLTPPGSPPTLSASASPNLTPKPLSPRRHSMSFSTSRAIFEDRSSVFSSASSTHSSISGSDAGSQSGRTRVDGKEFFRQVRSRLSYEQFGAFLANVKDLNSNKQTKEETLRKASDIFGPENKDLYSVFEGLITRNVH